MKKYIKSALCAVLIFLLITGCTNTLSDDSAGKKESKTKQTGTSLLPLLPLAEIMNPLNGH